MPVTLRANCIGSLALNALSNRSAAVTGQVLNTFSNSFYLKTGSRDLVFVTNGSVRSPITINLDTTHNLERLARPKELFHVRGKEIQIGEDSIIELNEASLYRSRPGSPSELGSQLARIEKSLRVISFILRIVDTSESVLDPRSLAHTGMVDFVSSGIIPLRRPVTEGQFREAALKIVGLGSGFTPSGDDVLGGFLLAYNSLARAIGRVTIFLEPQLLEEKTSWISAKLLDYTQRLIIDEQLQRFIDSVFNEDKDVLTIALETLLPRGHTSGIDIALGAILAMSLIRDVTLEKEETEIIARALGLHSLA